MEKVSFRQRPEQMRKKFSGLENAKEHEAQGELENLSMHNKFLRSGVSLIIKVHQ